MIRNALPATVAGLAMLASIAAVAAPVPEPRGVWLTENGDGAVEIFNCGERLCGRIVWQKSPLRPDGTPDIDERNPDQALRRRPICGLQILGDLTPAGPAEWSEGWVYDPNNGKTYHASVTLEGADALKMRGYIGLPVLGDSRQWRRAPADQARCAGTQG